MMPVPMMSHAGTDAGTNDAMLVQMMLVPMMTYADMPVPMMPYAVRRLQRG